MAGILCLSGRSPEKGHGENMSVYLKVTGIRETVRAIKQVETELPKHLKDAFLRIASDVAGKVQGKMPHKSGNAQASVKPRATAKSAAIVFGGTKAPYEPWLDFGGRVGRNKSIARPFIKEGRYLYPTLASEMESIHEQVDKAIADAIAEAGLE